MANAGYGFNTSKVLLVLTVAEDANTMKYRFGSGAVAAAGGNLFRTVADYLIGITGGARQGGKIYCATGAVAATGTVTFSSVVATDTVTINGVVFTGNASPSANQFKTGSGDTVAAASLAAAINASATGNAVNVVTATSAAAVVTVTAIAPGNSGNLCTLAISAHGSVSGANLTGGTQNVSISSAKGIA